MAKSILTIPGSKTANPRGRAWSPKFIAILIALFAAPCQGEEITGADLRQQRAALASGDFLVNDRVEKISITMNQGEFDVTVGGETFRTRPATNDKQVVNYSGNSLTLSEKRTSAKHAVGGSRYDKSTLLQVGDSATFLVKLSGGRIVSSKIATDEDRITLKFKNASPQQASESGASLDSEVQAGTLLIEIQKLEQEITTGVAGKAIVTGNNSFGQGFQGKVTYKFTEAEIAEKKKLLELKRAQLAGLVAQ